MDPDSSMHTRAIFSLAAVCRADPPSLTSARENLSLPRPPIWAQSCRGLGATHGKAVRKIRAHVDQGTPQSWFLCADGALFPLCQDGGEGGRKKKWGSADGCRGEQEGGGGCSIAASGSDDIRLH